MRKYSEVISRSSQPQASPCLFNSTPAPLHAGKPCNTSLGFQKRDAAHFIKVMEGAASPKRLTVVQTPVISLLYLHQVQALCPAVCQTVLLRPNYRCTRDGLTGDNCISGCCGSPALPEASWDVRPALHHSGQSTSSGVYTMIRMGCFG